MSKEIPWRFNEPWIAHSDVITKCNEWASEEHQVRAISCVNALAGMPQDVLEKMKPGELTERLREMAEALESILAGWDQGDLLRTEILGPVHRMRELGLK